MDTAQTDARPFQVRERAGWRALWQFVALLILVVASAGFVGGGLIRGAGAGSVLFMVLGALGIAVFGTGLLLSLGTLLNRRPILELTADGVRRPARWPLPRRTDRALPWTEVKAIAALRRGVHGTRRGEQDYLVFLPSEELLELARTAERPQLVALTLTDVPKTAEAARWCVAVPREVLPEAVRQARRHHEIPVVDRRNQ